MRRSLILIAALLAIPNWASAQDSAGYDPEVISIRQIEAQRDLDRQTSVANSSTDEVTSAGAAIGSQSEAMNRMIDNPNYSDFAAKAPQWAKEWDGTYGNLPEDFKQGLAKYNADTGNRIRIVNPYNSDAYARFYDRGTNSLQGTMVQGEYKRLEENRAAWDKSYQRAQQQRDTAMQNYDKMVGDYNQYQAIQSQAAAQMQQAQDRMNRIQTGVSDPSLTNPDISSGGEAGALRGLTNPSNDGGWPLGKPLFPQ